MAKKKGPTKSRKNLCRACKRAERKRGSMYCHYCIIEGQRHSDRVVREASNDHELGLPKPLTGHRWWNRRAHHGADKTAYYLALIEELEK